MEFFDRTPRETFLHKGNGYMDAVGNGDFTNKRLLGMC